MPTSSAPTSIRRLATVTTALPDDVSPKGPKAIVLDVALRLFAENGYAGASIRDIAAAAGLKPASIYAHYPSKEQILVQLINMGHAEHLRFVEQAAAQADTDPVAQLRAYVDGHVRFHAQFPMLALLVNHELHALSEDYVSHALAMRQQATDLMMNIVKAGQDSGAFVIGHDHWLAGAAIGAIGMRVAHWYTDTDERSVDEIVAAFQDFACRLVGAAAHQRPDTPQ